MAGEPSHGHQHRDRRASGLARRRAHLAGDVRLVAVSDDDFDHDDDAADDYDYDDFDDYDFDDYDFDFDDYDYVTAATIDRGPD